MSSSKDILYHYTDFAALDGILSNSELRLNNILNMNDASEMILFMNGLCKAVSGMFREKGDRERAEWTADTATRIFVMSCRIIVNGMFLSSSFSPSVLMPDILRRNHHYLF
ncbi:MAG: hypothetical protein LUD01_07185 [Clostridiales bacterium]|nr:hypothetical protein [Clostridiales bacterium]